MESLHGFVTVHWDHEPADGAVASWRVRQSSGAFARLASIAKAPEDWRTPKPGGAADGSWKAPYRFSNALGP